MRGLWFVEDWVISRYNHPARGDYNTIALIFKMATARFLDVFEEETNKMKENAIALIITCAIIPKQLFSSGSVNNCSIIAVSRLSVLTLVKVNAFEKVASENLLKKLYFLVLIKIVLKSFKPQYGKVIHKQNTVPFRNGKRTLEKDCWISYFPEE